MQREYMVTKLCDEILPIIHHELDIAGFRVEQSFDLRSALALVPNCTCPHHGTALCDCQYNVLLIYILKKAMSQAKILVVDDEPNIVSTVRAYLEQDNFRVFTAFNGPDMLEAARNLDPDLIVLDIMLPGLDGLELLREVRKQSDVYVLMLTTKTEETDRIVGLTLGADDYMTKPFSPRELVARVKAIFRRSRGATEVSEITHIEFERLTIDLDQHRVWKDGEEIELTAMEFDLLRTFAKHPGLVLSREQLIRQVWEYDYYSDDRVVDVHVGRLRKKIEDEPANPTLITTVRGAGYRFEDTPV